MILKQVRLKNIRSYIDETIDLKKGNLLLSGDIGSGKSTILLAIEFALFGLMRSDLSGSSLLRHGESKGSVQLAFEVNNKEFMINRTLKRTKNTITQDSGHIVKDNSLQPATPVEIKAFVLELLGYPPELLTKSKNLIYRFTVYTPQEQMKAILYESIETRLNILRKLFNIDKYQRIKENTSSYLKNLREQMKLLEGKTIDLQEKQKQSATFIEKIKLLDSRIAELEPILKTQKEAVNKKQEHASRLEKQTRILYQLKQQLGIHDTEQKSLLAQILKNRQELEILVPKIKALEKSLQDQDKELATDLPARLKSKNEELILIEKNIRQLEAKLSELKTKKNLSLDLKNKVDRINHCPTCLQQVSDNHKKSIFDEENKKIEAIEREFNELTSTHENHKQRLESSKKEMEQLNNLKTKIAIRLEKTKALNDFLQQRERINGFLSNVKKAIGELNTKKLEAQSKISELSDIEESFQKEKQEFKTLQNNFHKTEISYRELLKEKQDIQAFSQQLNAEIKQKIEAKEKQQQTRTMHDWLKDFLLPLAGIIEKQVFTQVYHQFNSYFENWFTILMEDENLTARLDDTFSPILSQNGYDTTIHNLSGGEKTACALAYRLALNKIVNDFISTIQTKDLLILDEPTDGFSSEQLDKMRDVLDQLDNKQTIIVSHEKKIESFVDKVLQVRKQDHMSVVG